MMTRNITIRLPIDLIASADRILVERGIRAGGINELIRIVLTEFCIETEPLDELSAYQYVDGRFSKKKATVNAIPTADEIQRIAAQLRGLE